ncbi:MAG: hypothetical protein AAF639_29175 [Chloroflexota bacterium]
MKIIIDLDPAELKQLLEQFNGSLSAGGGPVNCDIVTASATREKDEWGTRMRAIHQENLRQLMMQLATYPQGEKPLHLLNQVASEERAMRKYNR